MKASLAVLEVVLRRFLVTGAPPAAAAAAAASSSIAAGIPFAAVGCPVADPRGHCACDPARVAAAAGAPDLAVPAAASASAMQSREHQRRGPLAITFNSALLEEDWGHSCSCLPQHCCSQLDG